MEDLTISAIQYFKPNQGTFLTILDFCLKTAFDDVSGFRHWRDAFHYGRTLAAYTTCEGILWIITEWDRSSTTLLFPDEY